MDKELFEDLKTSIKEAGAIRRGEVAPARKTTIVVIRDEASK